MQDLLSATLIELTDALRTRRVSAVAYSGFSVPESSRTHWHEARRTSSVTPGCVSSSAAQAVMPRSAAARRRWESMTALRSTR